MELTSKLFHHVVPDHHDCMGEEEEQQQFPHKGFWRVKECLLFKQAVRSLQCTQKRQGKQRRVD